MHVPELQPHGRGHPGRAGASPSCAAAAKLTGASVMATDLRASASPRARRARRERQDRGAARLSPRSRLRGDREEAARASARRSRAKGASSENRRTARPIILALPKGRILDEAAAVFRAPATTSRRCSPTARKLVTTAAALRVLVAAQLRHADLRRARRRRRRRRGSRRARRGRPRALRAARSRHRALPHDRRRARRRATSTSARSSTCASPRSTRARRAAYLRAAASPPRSSSCRARSSSGRSTGLCERIVDITQIGRDAAPERARRGRHGRRGVQRASS